MDLSECLVNDLDSPQAKEHVRNELLDYLSKFIALCQALGRKEFQFVIKKQEQVFNSKFINKVNDLVRYLVLVAKMSKEKDLSLS